MLPASGEFWRSVESHLAYIPLLFDWLVTGQIIH
jgi:hypothetical protein